MAFNYKSYKESDDVLKAKNAMDAHNATKLADWTGGTYGASLQNALDRINNREKFSYDLNGDALYNQYKDQYVRLGKMAMQDTMGQAASLTGGYGNSYANTVGNQAYQGYLQNLNNIVPDLYQLAYDKYNRDTQDLYNNYNLLADAYNNEYGRYRDQMADWYKEADRLGDNYYNLYKNDYGKYSDAYERALANYKLNLAESPSGSASNGGSGSSNSGSGKKTVSGEKETVSGIAPINADKGNNGLWFNSYRDFADAKMEMANNKLYSDAQYMSMAMANEGAKGDKSYYTEIASDIKKMESSKAKDYIKQQWANGNLSDAEYQTLYNTLRK